MNGKCFGCGKTGHHQDRCPNCQSKKVSTKCYYCNLTGHYRNDCPKKIADEKVKVEQVRLELAREDQKWMDDHFAYSPRAIEDFDSIKIFLNNSPLKAYQTLYLELTTNSGQVYPLTFRGGKFIELPGQSSPLGRHLDGMNILEFINFLWDHSSITKLTHGIYSGMSPESMISFLEKVDFAVHKSTGKKSCETLIGGKVVMSGYDERGWEYHVEDEALILETYKRCMSYFQLEINIVRL